MSGRVWPAEVVERVARAICVELGGNPDDLSDWDRIPTWCDYTKAATAALDAAALALAVDAEGEVARLRERINTLLGIGEGDRIYSTPEQEAMRRRYAAYEHDVIVAERDEHRARADAAETRLAEVAEWLDENHMPWNYTEFGVLCACGSAMDADEACIAVRPLLNILAADSTETVTPADEAVDHE